jgi:hypothetical protein
MNGCWLDGLVGNPLALAADVGAAIATCLLPLLVATTIIRLSREPNVNTAPMA